MESIKKGSVIKGHGDTAQSEEVLARVENLVWTRTQLEDGKVGPINAVQDKDDLTTYGYTVVA